MWFAGWETQFTIAQLEKMMLAENLILVLGISGWVTYARVSFGLMRSFKERTFVQSIVRLMTHSRPEFGRFARTVPADGFLGHF